MKKAKRLLASTMLCTLALQSVAFATGNGGTASMLTWRAQRPMGAFLRRVGVVLLVYISGMIQARTVAQFLQKEENLTSA